MIYDNLICPHCGKRYGDRGIGGFGGLRGLGGLASGGSTKGYFGSDGLGFSLRSRGGPATSSGPENSTGPRTTAYGTGASVAGSVYREDRWGFRRYL